MPEDHPERVASVQHKLQQIVVSVARTHSKSPVEDVREVLRTAMDAAGIPQQPDKWVEDTAIEIAGGRLVVMNPREDELLGVDRSEVSPVDPEDPEDTTS